MTARTVVELHGPSMAAVGLAWVLGAVFVRRPGVATAIAMGLAAALATGMHSSGALLPAPILGALLLNAWPAAAPVPFVRRLSLLCLAGIVHGALVLAFTGGVGQFSFVRQMTPVSIAMEGHVLEMVAWEGLWPFLPYSALFGGGLRRPAWRRLTMVVALSLPLYLVPSYLVLATWREYGAYLIPLAFPAAAIVVGVLPRGWTIGAILAAATVAIVHVVDHDHPERPREYAAGVRALAGGSRVHVLGGNEVDIEANFVAMPDTDFVMLTLPPFIDAPVRPPVLAALDGGLTTMLRRGDVVLLSRGADAWLRQPGTTTVFPVAGDLLPHIEAHYELEAVRVRGFVGWQVRLPK